MFHLSRSKKTGKYHIALFGKNYRMLSSTEANGLNTRKGALKNIRAQRLALSGTNVFVQDNTIKNPGVFLITPLSLTPVTGKKLQKPYVPGKKK